LGNFPKTIPALSPDSQNEKIEENFPKEVEEEFGYYKQ